MLSLLYVLVLLLLLLLLLLARVCVHACARARVRVSVQLRDIDADATSETLVFEEKGGIGHIRKAKKPKRRRKNRMHLPTVRLCISFSLSDDCFTKKCGDCCCLLVHCAFRCGLWMADTFPCLSATVG